MGLLTPCSVPMLGLLYTMIVPGGGFLLPSSCFPGGWLWMKLIPALANKFNQVIAIDLKHFKEGVYFFHLIDLFSRFSLSQVITRKLTSVIVDAVIKMWIASGFGAPRKFLIDNGGEFANNLYKEMAAHFNVEVCNTGAESPWQNGICERNHAVIDLCVEKMLEDDQTLSSEVALAWAENAKNSISNCSGFSPYQLVLEQNPNLPSVLTDDLPALEGKHEHDSVTVHLNALHAARKAFVKTETSERIRRALRHKLE